MAQNTLRWSSASLSRRSVVASGSSRWGRLRRQFRLWMRRTHRVTLLYALAGALIDLDMTALFAGAGSLIVLAAVLAAMHPAIKAMGIETTQ